MSKIKIVTDSIANLTDEEIKVYDVHIVNLNVLVDGVSYIDSDEKIAKETFYQVLNEAKELPKTSQPSIGTFLDVYDSFEDGTEIISIHVASSLSGTASAAQQAGDLSKNHVTVIDSEFADRGQAYQVIEAAKLAQAGASKEEILEKIKDVKEKTTLYISVFSLDNLVRGGRVSRAKGLLSNLLNVKVIFEFKDGVLTPMQKGRGSKSIQKFLDEQVYPKLETLTVKECSLSYVCLTEFLHEQIDKLKSMFQEQVLHIGFTVPTVCIHTGEGAFAMMYYHD
ncbi:DegV family protein [Carnobacteriaceae bacterium zg-ZUI78]|nr:DegV family protein [Carnobacteriaceae bacterium zg-ZUI78]